MTLLLAGIGLLVLPFGSWGPQSDAIQPAASPVAVSPVGLAETSESDAIAAAPPQGAIRTGYRNIEDIRVGQRVMAHNPQIALDERAAWDEPDWSAWRTLELEMPQPGGGTLQIAMIRPREWRQVESAQPGTEISLDLPEMGACGVATVISISACPEVRPGPGQVVTATFAHPPATQVLDVTIGSPPTVEIATTDCCADSDSESIGVTDNHLFWSVDRHDFIPIGEMAIGERLLTYHGDTKRVLAKLPRPGPQTVYNLEVYGENVYFVGLFSSLVHNSYVTDRLDELVDAGVLNHKGRGLQSGTVRYEFAIGNRSYLFDVDGLGRTVRAEGIWNEVADNARSGYRQSKFLQGANGRKWNASHLFSREAGGPWDAPNFVKGDAKWNQRGAWRDIEHFLNENAVGKNVVMNIHYNGPRTFVPESITVSGTGFRKIVDHP
jgi:hypothetical protein